MKHPASPPIADQAPLTRMIETRLSRRSVLRGGAALSVTALSLGTAGCFGPSEGLSFKELPHGATDDHVVADGYDAKVLMRWGDPVEKGASAFDPNNVTAKTTISFHSCPCRRAPKPPTTDYFA